MADSEPRRSLSDDEADALAADLQPTWNLTEDPDVQAALVSLAPSQAPPPAVEAAPTPAPAEEKKRTSFGLGPVDWPPAGEAASSTSAPKNTRIADPESSSDIKLPVSRGFRVLPILAAAGLVTLAFIGGWVVTTWESAPAVEPPPPPKPPPYPPPEPPKPKAAVAASAARPPAVAPVPTTTATPTTTASHVATTKPAEDKTSRTRRDSAPSKPKDTSKPAAKKPTKSSTKAEIIRDAPF